MEIISNFFLQSPFPLSYIYYPLSLQVSYPMSFLLIPLTHFFSFRALKSYTINPLSPLLFFILIRAPSSIPSSQSCCSHLLDFWLMMLVLGAVTMDSYIPQTKNTSTTFMLQWCVHIYTLMLPILRVQETLKQPHTPSLVGSQLCLGVSSMIFLDIQACNLRRKDTKVTG